MLLKLFNLGAVLRIRMFFGLPDSDPLVRGTDPDPSIKQNSNKNFDSYGFVTFFIIFNL